MLSTKEIVAYIKASQATVRPVNLKKFAEAIGISNATLSLVVNDSPRIRGTVPRLQESHLIRATEVIQMLEAHNLAEQA